MMETGSNMTVADVVALSGNRDHLGGFEGLIYLAVIASMFGGNGWFGNNDNSTADALFASSLANGTNNAISSDMQRGFDNQNSMANQRDILSAINYASSQGIAATNQTFHDTLGALTDKYSELQRDIAANAVSIQQATANQNQCCCETKQLVQSLAANTDSKIAEAKYDNALGLANVNSNIASNRYEAALNTASINENTTAQVQKVLDAIAQEKAERLQARINSLELQNAVAGVVRYPMETSYSMPSPCFCQGQSCC